MSRRYRVWAYESAALDLALRQAGTTLHEALDRRPRPVRFVVSLRLGEPPSMEPLRKRLDAYPSLRFKLDPTSSWSEELIAELVATGAVESVDFKGYYSGSIVDQAPDPVLYRRVVEAFPNAWIEDPALTPETDAVLETHRERFSWDAPIHSVADIEALALSPADGQHQAVATWRAQKSARRFRLLRRAWDRQLRRRPVRAGRGSRPDPVSGLAVPCGCPERCCARRGYNLPEPPTDLPQSPLAPAAVGSSGFAGVRVPIQA